MKHHREILGKSWKRLKDQIFLVPIFRNEAKPRQSMTHDQDSVIRCMGGEEYLRTNLFYVLKRELQEIILNNPYYSLSVESRLKGSNKRPDIILWDTENALNTEIDSVRKEFHNNAEFIIETKLTGNFLFNPGNQIHNEAFQTDLKKYVQGQWSQSKRGILFYAVYYESSPSEILDIIETHGSLLNFCVHNNSISQQDYFILREILVEGYAFRGLENWKFVDNKSVSKLNKNKHGSKLSRII